MIDFSSMYYTVFNIVVSIIQIFLKPIDDLIFAFLPDLSSAFTGVGALLNMSCQYIGWVISLVGLSPRVISLLVAYYTFKLTLPVQMYFIKLVIAWYNRLKM